VGKRRRLIREPLSGGLGRENFQPFGGEVSVEGKRGDNGKEKTSEKEGEPWGERRTDE